MKRLFYYPLALIFSMCFVACSDDDAPSVSTDEEVVEQQMKTMSLREKVGQLFCVRPEALDTTIHWTSYTELPAYKLQAMNETMRKVNEKYPVGGIVLYAYNINEEQQLMRFISDLRQLGGSPLLCVDEEGGRVARIANNSNFNVTKYESMTAIGNTGDPQNAYNAGNTIGKYLHYYGFDIDFAPVADVNTNPDNIVIGARAFSDDPAVAAPMVVSYLNGLSDAGITGCLKHFPGHGDTYGDTHDGFAESRKTWDEMLSCEMLTFRAGIQAGAQLVMTAHISTPNITGSSVPATMSSVILQDLLRGQLGYQNLIITDAMDMGAIVQNYTPEEAAVSTLKAGTDIILCPLKFCRMFDAVVEAVEDGTISKDRIDQSVRRVLLLKKKSLKNRRFLNL